MESVSVENFAKRYGLKPKTIIKNIGKIKGAYKKNGEYIIPDSCRYPFFPKNLSLKTKEDKKYAVLRATFEYKYVDNYTVLSSKNAFEQIVEELENSGMIKPNGTNDKNGLNGFNVTEYAEMRIKELGKKKLIMKELCRYTGIIVGAAISTYESMNIN